MYNLLNDRVVETCEAHDQRSSCGDSFIYLEGYEVAQMFLTYEQLVTKLMDEKNLTIQDRTYAILTLKRIGYFALISGYKKLFKNSTTKKYKDGTKIEDIVLLYHFDKNLRELFLKNLLTLERHISSLLSYYFTEKFGEAQCHYLNRGNFNCNDRNNRAIDRLILKLHKKADTNEYDPIRYHRETYQNVPLWVLVNVLTFGELSKFYQFTTQDLQCKISKNFNSIKERALRQILSVLTKFRNACAHNERLFMYKTKDDIPDLLLHSRLNIPKSGTTYRYGKKDLFAVVLSLRYLLLKSDFSQFKNDLSKLITCYVKQENAINRTDLLQYMGFPENWEYVTRYRNI